MLATIFFIPRMEFDVTIAGSFVFEESQTKVATERHLVTVRLSSAKGDLFSFLIDSSKGLTGFSTKNSAYLFVFLEKRQSREGSLTESATERDGQCRVGGQSGVGIACDATFDVGWRRRRNDNLSVCRWHFLVTSLCID